VSLVNVPSQPHGDASHTGTLHEAIEGAGEARRVDHATVLGREDQGMVVYLGPALSGDPLLQLLEFPALLRVTGTELVQGEHRL
jgi:hypothetical protein